MAVAALPDLNVLPADALRALILAQHEQLLSTESTLTATQEQLQSREREIEHLKLLLAKLQRMQFGRKSEKLERQIEQLELRLEELESKRSEQEPTPPDTGFRHRLLRLPVQRSPRAAHCPIICRDKRAGTSRKKPCVRNARASYASWARMSRRCWSTCPPVSWWSATCARS